MTLRKDIPRSVLLAALVLLAPAALLADTRNGPDPYGPRFGFDRPEEADWGGWTRGVDGTLYAEWDVFSDRSHGGANDRGAAPDLGSFGTSSAWIGWNNGTFVSGTGNLYSFTVPQLFSVELAGAVPAGPLRVVLQVETQGQLLDYDSFALNNAAAAETRQTYRDPTFPSPLGATDLVHRIFIWNLDAPPVGFVFRFASKQPHVSLTQAAVDIGPVAAANPVPNPRPDPTPRPDSTAPSAADRTVLLKLPAEDLDSELAARLHQRFPRVFPEVWADRDLIFVQATRKNGSRRHWSLKGGVTGIVYDGTERNRVFADIYRPDEAGDVKLAECRLDPTRRTRWRRVETNAGAQRYATAFYRLDLRAKESIGTSGRIRLVKRFGACQTILGGMAEASSVPALLNGDYALVRRAGAE